MREARKKRKLDRQVSKTELVNLLAGEFDFKVEIIAPYQLRLFLLNGTIDYFPQSGKATILGSGEYFKIPDIEKYISEIYPF